MEENKYLFSGKAYCGVCGWKMRGKMGRNKKIYICSKYNKNGTCDRNQISEEYILDTIHEDIKNVNSIIVKNGDIEIKYY